MSAVKSNLRNHGSARPTTAQKRPRHEGAVATDPAGCFAVVQIDMRQRPLMTLETAEQFLKVNRVKLLAMIDAGEIAWSWNIRARGSRNSELRVLAHSVVEHQVGVNKEIGSTWNMELPEVLNLVLPATRQTMRGTELQRLFVCGPDHIRALSLSGELAIVPESRPKVGPNAFPHFTRGSVARFLARRRIT